MIFLPKHNKTPYDHANYRPRSLLEVVGHDGQMWHDGLRYKLRTAQLSDTMSRIISNYLADRTATVRMGDLST